MLVTAVTLQRFKTSHEPGVGGPEPGRHLNGITAAWADEARHALIHQDSDDLRITCDLLQCLQFPNVRASWVFRDKVSPAVELCHRYSCREFCEWN